MFKVGDLIKGKENEYGITDEKMTKAEVIKILNSGCMTIKVLEHENCQSDIGKEYDVDNDEDKFELIAKIIKKSDLQNGDIVTYRNKDKRIVDKNCNRIVYLSDFENLSFSLDDFEEDLMRFKEEKSEWDIIKVYRPKTEETFCTERTKKVKEMTLKEVCKELGYEVKIIKE